MAATPPPLPLVSRDVELAHLHAMLTATAAGTGGCTVVTGPPGIGKTRLVDAAVREAATLGIATAAGKAKELDRIAPLATLMGTLRRTAPDTLDLDPLRGHEGDRFWYIDRIGELLEVYVAKQPLLIAIDDAQWADEFSVLALRVLVPALSSSPLRWVFARRPVPTPSPAQDTLDWLVADGADEIRPGLLGEAAVAQLKIGLLLANAFKGLAQETSRTAPKPAA